MLLSFQQDIKKNKGFSIIELILALSILLIAATAFLPVFTFVAKSNSENEIKASANAIAAGIFEKIEGMKYDDIGFVGGNPSGILPASDQDKSIARGNVEYRVQTFISWGSAVDKNGNTNPVAFKNIKVIVKAKDAFSGSEQVFEKMYSISARESEQPMNVGNIRVQVKNADNVGLSAPSISISASGPQSYTANTDENGEVIFGEIKLGTYSVSAAIPSGYYAPQGETSTNTVQRTGIGITGWSVKDVFFYMDTPDRFSGLNIKLKDIDGNIINSNGTISILWTIDNIQETVLTKDFTNGNLDAAFIGRLWPVGTYSIKVTFPASSGYATYDMDTADQKPIIEGTTNEWDGSFAAPGETKNIVINVGGSSIDAFTRIEAESYSSGSGSIIISNCSDFGGGQQINAGSGSYVMFKNVDFGSGANIFQARLSSTSSSTITLRIDNAATGAVIGTINTASTPYATKYCLVSGVSGKHDLYLIFDGSLNLNWFYFGKFFDDFSDNSIGPIWTRYNGTWVETGGILKQTSSSAADPIKVIASGFGLSTTTNYTIKAKVRVDSWSGGDQARAGVSLFSNTSNGKGYNLLFHNNQNTVQFLNDKATSGWSNSFEFNWSVGTWYWFMLKSNGAALSGKVWKDGDPEPDWMYTWTAPSPLRTGYPALNGGSGNCTVSFDEVTVTAN